MIDTRPIASLSLDLDNLWSYLKVHGDPSWASRPSYLEAFLPRALDVFDALGLRITFFIVGADAAMPSHRDLLWEIVRRGHEDMALVPADELSSLQETAYLLRSPENAARLLAALARGRRGQGRRQDLAVLRRELLGQA